MDVGTRRRDQQGHGNRTRSCTGRDPTAPPRRHRARGDGRHGERMAVDRASLRGAARPRTQAGAVQEMTDATLYSVERGIGTITLNRPDNRNALSIELMNSLGDNLTKAIADEAV